MVKPLLSNKFVSNEKITLVEDANIAENDKNTASVLNKFFSYFITNLGISHYNETEPVSHKIGRPLMKTIMNYRFHPSVIAIKENCSSSLSDSISQIERDEIMKESNNFKINKVTQSIDILTKLHYGKL